jgi:DNA-binding CsgD family transcriptional regulator
MCPADSSAAAASASAADLLEREREAAAIDAALHTARAGSGGLVLVEGEAGIGKTRLLTLACARARAAGMQVLGGRGGPLERHFPFGVVRQLFEPALARAGASQRRSLVAGAASAAAVLLDASLPEGQGIDLMRALHGLYWLCSNLAERAPLLLAVDDAHWADAESLRWLSYMANRVEDLPLVLVVTVRPAENLSDQGALAAIASAPRVELLHLAPLTERASAQLVRRARGQRAAREFCDACRLATGGNPYYLRELLLETEAQQVKPLASEAGWVAELGPPAIASATLVRIARLPPACPALARAVAVLGLDVVVRDAAELAGIDFQTAEDAADHLAAAGILQAARPLNFKHPVVGAAIYADVPAGARSRGHASAAELLARQGAEVGRVAAQLLHVEPSADQVTLERLRAAAGDSLRRGAPATAASYLRRALAETASAQVRVEVLLELGRAELIAGEPGAIEHLSEVIEADPEVDILVDAAVSACNALHFAGRYAEARELVERTIDRLGPRPAPRHELPLESYRMQLAALTPSATAEQGARLPGLLARAQRAGSAGRSMLVIGALAAATRGDTTTDVPALIERALQRGRAIPEQLAESPLPAWGVISLVLIDQLDAADELLEALFADARARGSVFAYDAALIWRGFVALRRGLIPAAEADERAAAELARQHGLRFAIGWAEAFLARALIDRGEIDGAGRLADALEPPGSDDAPLSGIALDARARVRIAQGRYDEGIADLRAAGAAHESIASYNPNILHWRSSLALALGRESPEALPRVDVELEQARRLGYPRAIGVALRARGLLDGSGDGIATLREAAAILEPSPARLEYARTLLHLGGALRRDGHRAAAREPLRQALALADNLGAEAVASEAQAELVASGGRPRRRELTGVESLTPTERRVAELAALGRANREIAQALFVSRKTVEMHLGHAYRKLDIRSRAELPAALHASSA